MVSSPPVVLQPFEHNMLGRQDRGMEAQDIPMPSYLSKVDKHVRMQQHPWAEFRQQLLHRFWSGLASGR